MKKQCGRFEVLVILKAEQESSYQKGGPPFRKRSYIFIYNIVLNVYMYVCVLGRATMRKSDN